MFPAIQRGEWGEWGERGAGMRIIAGGTGRCERGEPESRERDGGVPGGGLSKRFPGRGRGSATGTGLARMLARAEPLEPAARHDSIQKEELS